MNPSDRLEEIKKDWDANHIVIMGDVDWLIGESARTEKAEARVKELEQAIRRHQERDWSEKSSPYSDWDEELYALLGGKL